MPKKSPEVTLEVTETEIPEVESLLVEDEAKAVQAHTANGVKLDYFTEQHSLSGIELIGMYGATRSRLLDLNHPKNTVNKLVYDNFCIEMMRTEVTLEGETLAISERSATKLKKEYQAIMDYYESSLIMAYDLIPFSLFVKVSSMHKEHKSVLTANSVNGARKPFMKKVDGKLTDIRETLTTAQLESAGKQYANNLKNLIVMAEAKLLAKELGLESLSTEETKFLDGLKGLGADDLKRYASIVKLATMANNGDYSLPAKKA